MDQIVADGLSLELSRRDGVRVMAQSAPVRVPAPPAARSQPLPEVPPGTLLGRDEQLRGVLSLVAEGRSVGLRGPGGAGKSTFLYCLARLLGAGQPPGAVIYLHALDGRIGDMLHRVFQAVYRPETPVRPSREELVELLARTESFVLLDDLAVEGADLAELCAALPRCVLVVTARRELDGFHGTWLRLPGLAPEDALELFRQRLGRALTAAESEQAGRLHASVDGSPLQLLQGASLVRAGTAELAEVAELAVHDLRGLRRRAIASLRPPERLVAGVLAIAAGTVMPVDMVAAVSGDPDTDRHLTALGAWGLAHEEPGGFALTAGGGVEGRRALLTELDRYRAVRVLAEWLVRQDTSGWQARLSLEACLGGIVLAAEGGDWAGMVQLVRGMELVMALTGRWEAWRDVLEQGLEAARRGGDEIAEGDFAHQLGSLALCLRQPEAARALLEDALGARSRQGHPGAAVTAANLALMDGDRQGMPEGPGASGPGPSGPPPDLSGEPDGPRWGSGW